MEKKVSAIIMLSAVSLITGSAMANLLTDAGFEQHGDVGASYKYLADADYGGYWIQLDGNNYLVQSPGWISSAPASNGNMMQLYGTIYNWTGSLVAGQEYRITIDATADVVDPAPSNNIAITIGNQTAMYQTVPGEDVWQHLTFSWTASADDLSGANNQALFYVWGNNVWIDNMEMVAVPEPTTLGLLSFSGLLFFKRK